MAHRPFLSLAAVCLVTALAGCSGETTPETPAEDTAAAGDPLAALGIETAVAEDVQGIPLGSVPGMITLPPEARVAVTAPFPGAALRVFVIEGQAVRKGQALAVVRAVEPVRIRGDLARSQAELGMVEARAKRLEQLAEEGIIAQARADEARAELIQARASVTENNRMASLAGAGADGTMTLAAPISGRVQHVGVETGGAVDGMTAPFVIEATGDYRVDLQLPERMARNVKPGMGVQVMVPGNTTEPMTVAGSILSVAPSIEPETRSVMAKARIGAAPGLVPGQNVMVTILGQTSGTGISVPSSAVTMIDGESYVFLRTGDGYEPRKVTVVAEAGGRSVLSDGLAAGDVVATSSVAELKAIAAE